MLFLLAAGIVAVVAPSWILCAVGLGNWDEDDAGLWVVRIAGVLLAGLAVYLMYLRR
jgi:hypothetical protein